VRSRIVPDDSPSWYLIGDRTSHVSLHAALAFRIVEWLSVGAGVRITFDEEALITGTATEVRRVTDPVTGEERVEAGTELGIEASIYGRASPILGVLVAPIPELRFGFAWRGELVSDDWGWSRLQGIEGVGDIGFIHRFTHVFRPHELAWSAAYRIHDVIEVSAELTWALWSQAVSPTWRDLGSRFGDTLVPAGGVRVTPTPGLDLLAGYRYSRAPLSDLGGPTNLLANDTHHASLGLELDLDALIEDEVPFTISLAGRLAILEEREERKDGRRFPSDAALLGNPGYPGYRYGGFVPSVQLAVETRW
jgi:long-subunit fatty acid transport protein